MKGEGGEDSPREGRPPLTTSNLEEMRLAELTIPQKMNLTALLNKRIVSRAPARRDRAFPSPATRASQNIRNIQQRVWFCLDKAHPLRAWCINAIQQKW